MATGPAQHFSRKRIAIELFVLLAIIGACVLSSVRLIDPAAKSLTYCVSGEQVTGNRDYLWIQGHKGPPNPYWAYHGGKKGMMEYTLNLLKETTHPVTVIVGYSYRRTKFDRKLDPLRDKATTYTYKTQSDQLIAPETVELLYLPHEADSAIQLKDLDNRPLLGLIAIAVVSLICRARLFVVIYRFVRPVGQAPVELPSEASSRP